MKTIIASLLLLIAGVSCGAQAAPAGVGPGSYTAIGVGVSTYQSDYGKNKLSGFVLYSDVNFTWRLGMETTIRRSTYGHKQDVVESSYLAGLRLTLLPGRIQPFVKLSAGRGDITFPYKFATGQYFVWASGAGVEIRATPRVSVRLADFEYENWPKFSYGAIHPYGLTMGVSYRLSHSTGKLSE